MCLFMKRPLFLQSALTTFAAKRYDSRYGLRLRQKLAIRARYAKSLAAA